MNLENRRQAVPAKIHAMEKERIQALHDLGVLDTGFEGRFDHITGMVNKILGFSSVLISLVDVNRQWFKSTCNFEARETPRDIAFCSHAINEPDGVLIIPDTLLDPRFSQNPLVLGKPFIRFYTGIVLRTPDQLPLGTLCLIDYEPRQINRDQLDILKDFAILVERELFSASGGMVYPSLASKEAFDKKLEIAMPADEFKISANSICEIQGGRQIVHAVFGIPKAAMLARTFGHLVVEDVVSELARRIRLALSGRKFLLGFDDTYMFSVILAFDRTRDKVQNIVDDLITAIGTRFQTSTNTIFTPITIGLAEREAEADDFDQLTQRSQIALETLGTNFVGPKALIYCQGLGGDLQRREKISQKLEYALIHDEIELHFQPKVSLTDLKIKSAEALLRWTDPVIGTVPPMEIVNAAHEIDMTTELEKWVFMKAVTKLKFWREERFKSATVSINLSASSLMSDEFMECVKETMAQSSLPYGAVDFEILESIVIKDFDHVVQRMNMFRAMGISFSLDDFGTGHSSLSYLQILPIDTLKVDRSFVVDLVSNQRQSAMVRQIIEIGHALKLKIVAEGVENLAQFLILRAYGCEFIQGYFFSKPVPSALFLELASENGGILEPEGLNRL